LNSVPTQKFVEQFALAGVGAWPAPESNVTLLAFEGMNVTFLALYGRNVTLLPHRESTKAGS